MKKLIIIFFVFNFLILNSIFAQKDNISVSKILPNNPLFFIKKIYLNLKEKFIKDQEKKLEFYLDNFLQAKKDFYFLLEKSQNNADIKKAFDNLRASFTKLKNFVLFNNLIAPKIKFLILNEIFQDRTVLQKKNLSFLESFILDEREFLLNLVAKDSLENNFELIKIISEKINKEEFVDPQDLILIFLIKETKFKESEDFEKEIDRYLKILPSWSKIENIVFTDQLTKWQVDFLLSYIKKSFREKNINLSKVSFWLNKIEKEKILTKDEWVKEINFWLDFVEDKKNKIKFQKLIEEENFTSQAGEILFSLIQDIVSPKPVCLYYWEPVCGVNGKTYANMCFLNLAKVQLAYQGSCLNFDDIEKEIQEITEPKDFEENFPEVDEFNE